MIPQALTRLLAPHLPKAAAFIGLSKSSNAMHKFLVKAAGAGYTADEVLEFMRNQSEGKTQKMNRQQTEQRSASGMARPDEMLDQGNFERARAPQEAGRALTGMAAKGAALMGGLSMLGGDQQEEQAQGNPIEQMAPELHQFIVGQLQQGRSPDEAGALAQSQKQFSGMIRQLESASKQPFSSILAQFYGQQQPQMQQAQTQNQGDAQLLQSMDALMQILR